MEFHNSGILVALLIPLGIFLHRDFIQGLAYAIFLCVSMPTHLRIPMPGDLPQLTIYRLVLILIFIYWVRNREPGLRLSRSPLFGVFCFWALTNLASLLLTGGEFVISLKRYLDFVLETAVFFLLLVTSLRNTDDTVKILRAACLGVTLVAALAVLEKYTGFNPVDYLVSTGTAEGVEEPSRRDIIATYQHRILLGAGMAMGWPLMMAMMLLAERKFHRARTWWFSLALVLAACYFSDSRGPWLATILIGGLLLVLGRKAVRKKLAVLLLFIPLVLVIKPGVIQYFAEAAKVTIDSQSLKGGNFSYRLELWRVAWAQVTRSADRFLFGYGPGFGLKSKVAWELSYRDGEQEEIWSWDNHLAYDLYQSGVVGLLASVFLYASVLLATYGFWRRAGPDGKSLMACMIAGLFAYVFMLTNVLIFAKPVNFLFWTIAAVSYSFGPSFAELETEDGNELGAESQEMGEAVWSSPGTDRI
jgi:O-antigen ligase